MLQQATSEVKLRRKVSMRDSCRAPVFSKARLDAFEEAAEDGFQFDDREPLTFLGQGVLGGQSSFIHDVACFTHSYNDMDYSDFIEAIS